MFNFFFAHIDPVWFWIASGSGFMLGLLGPGPIDSRPDAKFSESFSANVRKGCWAVIALLLLYALAGFLATKTPAARDAFIALWKEAILKNIAMLLAATGIGVTSSLIYYRHFVPWYSSWKRSARTNQNSEASTDIREEYGKHESLSYDVESYIDLSKGVFVGLDEEKKPQYLQWDLMKQVHTQNIGPTRCGKGVSMALRIAQVIRAGHGAFFFDPKPDENIPHIMAESAKKAGLPFVVLDFVKCINAWAPFAGGTTRERANRIIAAYRLEDQGGEGADFYKRAERDIVNTVMQDLPAHECSIEKILREISKQKQIKFKGSPRAIETIAVEDGLSEWKSIPNLSLKPKAGIDIAELLRKKSVVYVRCSDIGIEREAARIMLQEIQQVVLRDRPKDRKEHVFIFLDEARNLISQPVVSALTMVAGAGVTLELAYQSALDVRNLDDKRMDGRVVEASLNVNCQIKFVHGVQDHETALSFAELCGQKRVQRAMMESTEIQRFGGETWSDKRTFKTETDYLISTDTIKALPARVPIMVKPGQPAKIIRTHWLKYEKDAFNESVAALNATPSQSKDVVTPMPSKEKAAPEPKPLPQ